MDSKQGASNMITVDRKVLEQALEFVTSKQWGTTPYMDARVYEDAARLRDTLRAVLDQPVQEPVAREWQYLTDEEIDSLWRKWVGTQRPNYSFTRAAEATLKEKNT